jgi:hypothetical protein
LSTQSGCRKSTSTLGVNVISKAPNHPGEDLHYFA